MLHSKVPSVSVLFWGSGSLMPKNVNIFGGDPISFTEGRAQHISQKDSSIPVGSMLVFL